MADPKYAGLPGIAHGEPDVYETSDLPESDQTSDFYEEENDAIEKIHISANEAFNKFKGKTLEASKVDFSDRISRRLRTGYDTRSGEWELVAQGEKETPLQKYQRLQCEMAELFEEVKALKKGRKEGDSSCLVSEEQVEGALKKLADLRLEETLGAEVISSITDPQGSQLKKLMNQIDQFKNTSRDQPKSQPSTDNSGFVFQLNYKPELAKLQQAGRVAELEGRIRRLEQVIGPSDDKLARLAAATSKDTLFETAQYLSATASLLDSQQLDHIEGRLTALSQKLDSIAEKKASAALNADQDKMILESYQLLKEAEGISKILPETIERLKALESLHSKAADFARTLAQVETLQSNIEGNVQNSKSLLQGVQESFAVNLEHMNKTIITLDARIKALNKK